MEKAAIGYFKIPNDSQYKAFIELLLKNTKNNQSFTDAIKDDSFYDEIKKLSKDFPSIDLSDLLNILKDTIKQSHLRNKTHTHSKDDANVSQASIQNLQKFSILNEKVPNHPIVVTSPQENHVKYKPVSYMSADDSVLVRR